VILYPIILILSSMIVFISSIDLFIKL
jgi:hypothetical protein